MIAYSLLFSDIDNTLAYPGGEGKPVRLQDEDAYVSQQAIDLLEKIRQSGVPTILSTGRRYYNYSRFSSVIPHDGCILESGSVFIYQGKVDEEWQNYLQPEIGDIRQPQRQGKLWVYEEELRRQGFSTETKGRVGSFRIRHGQSGLEELEQRVIRSLPSEIMTTINGGSLDILPRKGGKANAARYAAGKLHISLSDAAAVGDDINDVDLLSSAGHPFTFAEVPPEVREIVAGKKGYICAYRPSHEGIIAILTQIASGL